MFQKAKKETKMTQKGQTIKIMPKKWQTELKVLRYDKNSPFRTQKAKKSAKRP